MVSALARLSSAGLFIFTAATPFSIAISQAGLWLAMLGWGLRAMIRRSWLLPRTSLDLPVLAYAGAELLAAATSSDHGESLRNAKRLFLLGALYLAAERIRTTRDLARYLVPLFAVVTLLSTGSAMRYLLGPGGLGERIKWGTHSMTTTGILVTTLCLATGGLLWSRPGRERWLLGGVVGGLLPCLWLTYTRSGWLGYAGAAALLLGLRRRILVPVLAVVLVAGYFLAPPDLQDRVRSSFEPTHPRNVERVHMWSAGLRVWRDYPITGIGDRGTRDIYREYMDPEAVEIAGHFHNIWIHLGATLGIVGVAAVAWLFWRIVKLEWGVVRRSQRRRGLVPGMAAGALGAFVAFQIAGLFEWNLGDAEVATLFWFSVGVAVACARLQEETAQAAVRRPPPAPPGG